MQEHTTETKTLIDRMFKAGAHFGFSKSRRHPSVTQYLFGSKQGFDIFDLEKTSALLSDASTYLNAMGKEGKRILLVGTKEEVVGLTRESAAKHGVSFVANRWVGGTLTNFGEIKKRIEYLLSLRAQKESGEFERKFTKKERLMLEREMVRLETNFGGILSMNQLPQVLVVIDPRHEAIAVEEANQLGIPVVAIMSSDCNARQVMKPVVVNDAQRASISLALGELLTAYEAGLASFVPKQPVVAKSPRVV
jgi:small subunit ribosomal protein S2